MSSIPISFGVKLFLLVGVNALFTSMLVLLNPSCLVAGVGPTDSVQCRW